MEQYDIIVAGAGAMGMSAGYHAAARGFRTLLIDADNPPHGNGTHHGETRIIRHAYGEGRVYTPMALRAQALWHELEKETGRRLFLPTGFLQAGEPGSALLVEMMAGAEEHGLPVEVLDRGAIRRRWPDLALPESHMACYEPEGGILLCGDCIMAYRKAALARGAVLKVHTPVTAIFPDSGGVTVEAGAASYRAKSLVLTAGKFAGPMLRGIGLEPGLQPVRRTVAWFGAGQHNRHYDADRFPAFLFDLPEGLFYGFPDVDGSGIKVGGHDGEQRAAPLDGPLPPFGAFMEDGKDLSHFVARYMPGVSPTVSKGSSCTYTMTKDEHFIIDRHPDFPHIAIGAGFSGHGFKFASAVGEILLRLAVQEPPGFDLSLFSIGRFHRSSPAT